MSVRIIISVFCLFSFTYASSQDYEVIDTYDDEFGMRNVGGFLTFRHMLFADDYMLGIEAGGITPSENFTFFGSFDLRPFGKKILNHQSGNLFYQYAEQRFFVGAGVEYLQTMTDKDYGLFAQINANYTWGYYGGTEIPPPKGFVLTPKVGAFWRLSAFIIKAGYAYQDNKQPELENHRLYLAISALLHRK